MKIKAKVVFGSHDRTFHIPCGAGDKTIKWLGIVASQRYSNAAPNGALRRRDDFCGISDKTQYQVDHVYLPDGKIVHPGIMIFDSDLKDGDEVTVRLSSRVAVNSGTGSASQSKWSLLAFSTASIENPELNSARSEHDDDDDATVDSAELRMFGTENQEFIAQIKARAAFMRTVLHSQAIDTKSIARKLDEAWPQVLSAVPLLVKDDDIVPLKGVLEAQWDLLDDLFLFYAKDGSLDKETFFAFLDDSELFPVTNSLLQCAKIFERACKYCNVDGTCFGISSLIVGLLLATQVKFNDTLEAEAEKLKPHEALEELFISNFNPLAVRLKLKSVLKYAFLSDESLSALRLLYDDLQDVFNKSAVKFQDVPVSLPVEEVCEVLASATLLPDSSDHSRVQELLDEIRHCTMFGVDIEAVWGDAEDAKYRSENEITFPEFVEILARAGYHKFYEGLESADAEGSEGGVSADGSVESSNIIRSLIMGVKTVIEKNNSAAADKNPTPKVGRRRK
mmetsp:Transcript_19819/g.33675  ORF Transcript_19819/g.33675 Transcript_19819/m.33675 type:complete len:507 (-) Transcript_19819:137-1657(-)